MLSWVLVDILELTKLGAVQERVRGPHLLCPHYPSTLPQHTTPAYHHNVINKNLQPCENCSVGAKLANPSQDICDLPLASLS